MPLGFERLNERNQRPNALINFIKPLPGPDSATSLDYLNRIAAQCFPIMKANYLSVMALEEYESNPEFLGRNFNAGEVIQLVLKDKSGRWLGFKFVQMVMMHELAHCKQMNHSRAFWQVRNGYAGEMEALWAKKYLGEGMWGVGRDLASGILLERAPEQGDVPAHLCGGTYRRRGRKRKRGAAGTAAGESKPKVTYAERQQRRIAKKFGAHGEGAALGDDEGARSVLEGGKWQTTKPKVANSKRGRELRAQAALARFGAAKVEPKTEPGIKWERTLEEELGIKQEPRDSDTETEWDEDEGETDMVQVCGDEGNDEEGAQNEMRELRNVNGQAAHEHNDEADSSKSTMEALEATKNSPVARAKSKETYYIDSDTESELDGDQTASKTSPSRTVSPAVGESSIPTLVTTSDPTGCPICSLSNEPGSTICIACAHVLNPKLMPNHWKCVSETCRAGVYLNAGDCGICGLCGAAKPKAAARSSADINSASGMKPAGVIGADVLRWE